MHITLTSPATAVFLVIMASRLPQRHFEACSVFTHVTARRVRWPPTRPLQRVLQLICYLLSRPLCFRPERDWPGRACTDLLNRALARHTQHPPRTRGDQADRALTKWVTGQWRPR